jgi:hypothetical protein
MKAYGEVKIKLHVVIRLSYIITEFSVFCDKDERGRNCYNAGKSTSLFLWSDTWRASGKPCNASWQVTVSAGSRQVAVAFNVTNERTVVRLNVLERNL